VRSAADGWKLRPVVACSRRTAGCSDR
jgi:hypothetical protein